MKREEKYKALEYQSKATQTLLQKEKQTCGDETL